MFDTVKEHLAPKTFGFVPYICSIIRFLCGLAFTGIAIDVKDKEADKFTCYVSPKSTLIYKTQVDKACFSKYQQDYNAPLRFYIFVLLSVWFPLIVAVVYSLWVRRRVEQVDKTLNETQTDSDADNQVHINVFRSYFIHLALRALCGVLFAVLQHVLLFPRGFDSKFDCSLPPTVKLSPKNTSVSQLNNTASIPCENTSDKHTIWLIISFFNSVFAFVIFLEIIYLCRQFPVCKYITGKKCDIEFIVVHLLQKKYKHDEPELTSVSTNLPQEDGSSNLIQKPPNSSNVRQRFVSSKTQPGSVSSNVHQKSGSSDVQPESISVSSNLQQSVNNYKRQVLLSLGSHSTGLNLGTNSKDDFDKLYISLIVQTERALHKFSKHMERHEIYDVYMKVPRHSIHLEEIKDLFYPNEDTKQKYPHKILVIGRPGIGKTVLTEKILLDWSSELDRFYHDKIAFYFRFRWFNGNQIPVTLKTFLSNGTQLSNEKFQEIYEEITKHPEKAILIFDGLDEFNSDLDCPNDWPPPNDPDSPMSAISLFRKLISGHLLTEATVVVTSRPTANQFYSKFKLDRTVEIIGFTEARIEEYITKFCQSHNRDDLKPKIWNHIQSSSDLLNSCYIPVNCWIVVTILLESLKDPQNEIDALPTTLTDLYLAAVTHFDQEHFQKFDRHSSEEATKKLQYLAFKGIEAMQLIFDNALFDEEMKQSGLLNSLSNPYSQVQTQFCFIHLTIQEFLAAKHVIESFHPVEIKEFISSHINSGKWHLVLQFIAGLLGKQIKMLKKDRCEVKNCVLAFAKSFEFTSEDGVFNVNESYTSLLIMKCLREVEDEEIVREACKTTAINDIVRLEEGFGLDEVVGPVKLSSSDWSAVFLVCKHMKNLKKLNLWRTKLSEECYLALLRLLEQRCIEELVLDKSPFGTKGNIFKSLLESKCSLNHKHSKLVKLSLFRHDVTGEILSAMCEFFRNGHGICLKELTLCQCEISSHQLSIFCKVLDDKLCPHLTYLNFRGNDIADEGLTELCRTLTKQKLLKLTELVLSGCSLTNECVPALCELLTNECCNLIDLTLEGNPGIEDEGLHILCKDALTKEHCKLERLDLQGCSLTDECIPDLGKTLQDEHCKLTWLKLSENKITDKGLHMLCELALTKEHCKLVELDLSYCSLTDDCIPDLGKTLQDEHCKLKKLYLHGNKFTEKGKKSICEIAAYEHCKTRGLEIHTRW